MSRMSGSLVADLSLLYSGKVLQGQCNSSIGKCNEDDRKETDQYFFVLFRALHFRWDLQLAARTGAGHLAWICSRFKQRHYTVTKKATVHTCCVLTNVLEN